MAEATITRTQIIVVDGVGQNSYGDLTFTDKEGKEYKIPVKRKQYFDKIILPGMAVQLNYAMSSFGKDYIYSAAQVKDKLPDKPPEAPQSKPSPAVGESGSKPLTKDEQIERAVWIKEAGECIRSNEFDKASVRGKTLREAYYTEMCRVLGINIKEVEPLKSNLIEEAKRLGAKEIRKEEHQ